MKIISWNCNSRFREKITSIMDEDSENYLDEDIYVICECENPEDPLPKYNEYKRMVMDISNTYLSQCTFLYIILFNILCFSCVEINHSEAAEIQESGVAADLTVMFHHIILHDTVT
ncbi:hypothetical protein [Methanobrevibacter sp. V74]|uniref:hypothetical protein n=1 Tax=Methanobrevibacter sp. V74 TaxID=3064279 RepID=UPI00273418A3|nr:hypothetical protein [Methanobrevibacter sp. V74]